MRTVVVPTGPPGAGKSTFCNGLQQFMRAVARPCSVVNLDPANEVIPYEAEFDVRELVSVEEVMENEDLGPNGGILWAMEEVEANADWLLEKLDICKETILLDPPGQAELTTHHTALPRILEQIEKAGFRIVIVQLLDSVVLTRPSLYLSSLILCLRGMLHLPYPIVNVFTKIDNLKSVGGEDLPFNLDFYTEVQDLHYLLPLLSAEMQAVPSASSEKWDRLNEALVSLVQDHGVVGFETLAVEDRQSMASLLRAVDRASGHAFAGARATDEQGRTLSDEASIWAQAMSEGYGKMEVRDVQERWIERREEFDEMERRLWKEEARMAGALPEQPAATVRRKSSGENADMTKNGGDPEENELLAEQRRWQNRQTETETSAAEVLRNSRK